jgi:hypothetical protein
MTACASPWALELFPTGLSDLHVLLTLVEYLRSSCQLISWTNSLCSGGHLVCSAWAVGAACSTMVVTIGTLLVATDCTSSQHHDEHASHWGSGS